MKFEKKFREEVRFCEKCGGRLSAYNAGKKCFFHEFPPTLKPSLPTVYTSPKDIGLLVEGKYEGWL